MSARTKIRAAVLRSQEEPISVETIWLREVGPNDVRVRIDITGVCHSDLSLARGKLVQPLPAVLGHEASATILEVGAEVDGLNVDDRVIPLWNAPCRTCFYCLHGEPHLCEWAASRSREPHAEDADGNPVYPGLTVGSFAEQTVVPATTVVQIPSDISDSDAALLGCAVTTGVGAVTNTMKVQPNASVLVLGLGGVGVSVVRGAVLAEAREIIAVDRNPNKEAIARAAGATAFLIAGDQLRKEVKALTEGRGADYAFDCVGSGATVRDAWSLTRRGGAACVVGIGSKDEPIAFNPLELFHFARSLTGCVAGSLDPARDLPTYFEWLRNGDLDLAEMVTARGTLEQVEHALHKLEAGDGVRTLLHPNEDPAAHTAQATTRHAG